MAEQMRFPLVALVALRAFKHDLGIHVDNRQRSQVYSGDGMGRLRIKSMRG
jgi:hypothetical protein